MVKLFNNKVNHKNAKNLVKSFYLAQKRPSKQCACAKQCVCELKSKSVSERESPFTEYMAAVQSRVHVSYLPIQVLKTSLTLALITLYCTNLKMYQTRKQIYL